MVLPKDNNRKYSTETEVSVRSWDESIRLMLRLAGDNDESPPSTKFSSTWTETINRIRAPILNAIQRISKLSATNPKSTIAAVVLFSFGIFILGLLTNFRVEVDEDILWTPAGSHVLNHMNWLNRDSGFPVDGRNFVLVFHQDGGNVLGQDQVARIFTAVDTVRDLPGYSPVCTRSIGDDCPISGVIKFWNSTATIFQSQVTNDDEAILALSQKNYPDDGTPVPLTYVMGNAVRDIDTDMLLAAQNYMVYIEFPRDENGSTLSEDFEAEALDAIIELGKEWVAEPGNEFRLEVFADRSFPDEFERAILSDIPLVPGVFVLMGIFTCLIFLKRDAVDSRSLLGLTAVVSVLLSIVAGYGLMFLCGVPFTSMTQILPFVFFGVGLDDSYIIYFAFARLDSSRDTIQRVEQTIDDIGASIFLTTLTSSLAFGLGCLSSVPAVFWLCVYAVPTIVCILLFQVTFFIACLVLDERRVQAGNRDCFRCLSRKDSDSAKKDLAVACRVDRFMGWYAEILLKPCVKVVVLVCFAACASFFSMSASKLEQSFEFTDVLPGDSYITPFFEAFNEYSGRSSVDPAAYFRFVDQSSFSVQDEMEQYVNDLVTVDAIVRQPDFFWLWDFRAFVSGSGDVASLSFRGQVDAFLANPVYHELYANHIVRDSTGQITASRCMLSMDNVDMEDVKQQIAALEDQRALSESQPINKGHSHFRFFTYDSTYNIWEFYAASAHEIMLTTVSSVSAVTGVTLLLVPHWTAALFVLPLISILYIDLLGVMQWAGVSINPLSYLTLVMSVGLLVDFLLHILLRYYECNGNRRERTVKMLKTMGSSVLIGAITTFLGTLPLAFSTSDIFNTVFIAFLGLVALGATHGLILLPVLLSMLGTEETIAVHKGRTVKEREDSLNMVHSDHQHCLFEI